MSWCYNWNNISDTASMHGRRWFSNMMPMHGWGGGVLMVLFWVLIVAGVVYFILRLTRNNSPSGYMSPAREDSAIAIIKERFARGEISQEEYDEKLRILKERP